MQSIYPELALSGRKNEGSRTDSVFIPITQVCTRGVTLTVEMNIQWKESTKLKYYEVFKYNDEEGLKTFKEATTNTNHLSKIFDTKKSLDVQTKKFLKRLKGFINQSFKKIKISNRPDIDLNKLYDKRRYLRSKNTKESKKELRNVETELAEKYSVKMYETIKEEIKNIDSEDGGFNSGRLWKLKKKLSPKYDDPPTAMKNLNGEILTDKKKYIRRSHKTLPESF